jgi:2-methylisocitrate lyase-like PEP mutase family enzyme
MVGYGNSLRQAVASRDVVPFIGVYDVFSASLAARHYDALFCSGFGFAASYYGLPDIGFIAWSDMVSFVQRVRTILPEHHLLIDIDDGYCDIEVAAHVATLMERVGASGVVLEDQKRPRRCGHFDGKQIMELEEFLPKLERVLEVRNDLFVIARTDASDPQDVARRVQAFAQAGADAVLVDGVKDLDIIEKLAATVDRPFTFNQIAGGKSPPVTLTELKKRGVSLVIYSTPCLFAAQQAMDGALQQLRAQDGLLPDGPGTVGVKDCTALLQENHRRTGLPVLA